MKILFVTPCVGAHEAKFVRSLSENGYNTRIFSFHYHEVDEHIADLPNISLTYFPLRRAGRIQRFLPFHFLPRLKATIAEFQPDLIHAGNTWNDSFLSALSGFHPLLVMPYGSDVLLDTQRSPLFRFFNMYAFRHADWVTCDAEHVRKKIMQDFSYPVGKITVIPWGIDVGAIVREKAVWRDKTRKELSWENNFVVIMTRNHEQVYGVDVFLSAMEIVLRENATVRVLLIGGGPLHEEYLKRIQSQNLGGFFLCTGKIPYPNVLRYLQASDLYVSSSYSDGTSVSLLEAMASQLAVVLTDVPSNLEWVQNDYSGDIVKRGDHVALAQKILAMAASAERTRQFGERNLDIVKRRGDWKKNFTDIETIYHTLVH